MHIVIMRTLARVAPIRTNLTDTEALVVIGIEIDRDSMHPR
jgi:hypothetical protein